MSGWIIEKPRPVLKKCPTCGAVTSDDEPVCGVCGTGLAQTTSVSLQQAAQIHKSSSQMEARTNWAGIIRLFAIIMGAALVIMGIGGEFTFASCGVGAISCIQNYSLDFLAIIAGLVSIGAGTRALIRRQFPSG